MVMIRIANSNYERDNFCQTVRIDNRPMTQLCVGMFTGLIQATG